MHGFEGWLLKVNGTIFPMKYIRAETYTVTPDQETDLDDYTDNDGIFHRNILPAKATKIEFSTPHMWLQDMAKVLEVLPDNEGDNSVEIEYWNPRLLRYQSGTAYMPDVAWVPYMTTRDNIMYTETRLAFIEYGEVR